MSADPVMDWSDATPTVNAPCIWWTKIDDQYQVEIVDTGSDFGSMRIFDHTQNNLLVFTRDVLITSIDGDTWTALAANAIDNL